MCASELWSIIECIPARSLRALEEHEGASAGVVVHWRSMEEFGIGSAHIARRGETRADTLSWSELNLSNI